MKKCQKSRIPKYYYIIRIANSLQKKWSKENLDMERLSTRIVKLLFSLSNSLHISSCYYRKNCFNIKIIPPLQTSKYYSELDSIFWGWGGYDKDYKAYFLPLCSLPNSSYVVSYDGIQKKIAVWPQISEQFITVHHSNEFDALRTKQWYPFLSWVSREPLHIASSQIWIKNTHTQIN